MKTSRSFLPFDRPFLVIAHRGASHYAPENTMAAFRQAYEMRADMIELDVQLSGDGIPVVFHDPDLRKKTNGRGRVSSLSLRKLKELDAGAWFSSRFSGERIPALEEVLDWAREKILVNIEIKPETGRDFAEGVAEEKVIDLVRATGMKHRVVISGFDYGMVGRCKEIDPELVTGLLYDNQNKKDPAKKTPAELLDCYKADLFHCSRRELTQEWAGQLIRANKPFMVYTVNRKREMEKVINAGAYGIFSDKPDLLRTVADTLYRR